VTGRVSTKKPRGFRRVERWGVGIVMGVIAFVLEKVVMRSVKKKSGGAASAEPVPTTIISKGGEAQVRDDV